MQIQNNLKQAQIKRYKEIVNSRQYRSNKGRIKYDWTAAQLTIITHPHLNHQNHETLKLLNQLQHTYQSTFIPPFYTYYTIYSILQRNNQINEDIKIELSKTITSQNNYQNIAGLIFTRSNMVKQFIKKQQYQEDDIDKLRNITILTIIKVHQWQQNFHNIVNFPVFFLWEDQPYLLNLFQKNEGLFTNKQNHIYLAEPNPLLLEVDNSERRKEQIIVECNNILNNQKIKMLQLSLDLPFFAQIRPQQTVKMSRNLHQNSKQNSSSSFIKRKVLSSHSKLKQPLPALSQQQLQVIKKFRSIKNIKLSPSKPNLDQSVVSSKMKTKIDDLKEKVKNKTEASQVHQSNDIKTKLIQKHIKVALENQPRIKIVIERQRNINEGNNKKNILDSLNFLNEQKNNKVVISTKQKNKGEIGQQKINKIMKQTRFLLQNRNKQQQQLKEKNETLKNLKQDLMKKVKQKNTSLLKLQIKKDSNSPLKNIYHSKQIHKKNQQFGEKIQRQKIVFQGKQRKLLQQKEKFQKLFNDKEKQYQQKQRISKEIQAKLSLKKMKAQHLQEKLQQTQFKAQKMQDTDTVVQIQKLKQKKQMQYELQKQKIQQIQISLSDRVKDQQQRLATLQSQKAKQQAIMRQQFQAEVLKLQQRHERQQALIQQKIKQQNQKQLSYENKIKEEEQRLGHMQQQISEWQQKQQELLKLLRQQQRKQHEKQSSFRMQRQKKIDKQMKQLQKQQVEFLNKYKQANQHLIEQLEQLKQKNQQLEQKLSIH